MKPIRADDFILLVEDNVDDETLMLRALGKARIKARVAVARDGAEALELLLNPGADAVPLQPAVIFLDLKLPRIDGLEVLRRLRADERTHAIPVVVFSSSGESRDVLDSYHCGANSFVRKPIEATQFLETVGGLGWYWLQVNEPPA